MENEDNENSKFKDDVAEVLEYNRQKRRKGNGADQPQPEIGKLGDLLKKKADENQSEHDN